MEQRQHPPDESRAPSLPTEFIVADQIWVTTGGQNRIWITWERQRRNRSVSAALGAQLFEIDIRSNRVWRYLLCAYQTLRILATHKPGLVFVQNPSIVLSLLAMSWCRLSGTPIVMDAHNAGVYPFEGRRPWANRVAQFLFRTVSLTLVTNEALADYVKQSGGRAFVLPDPLPVFKSPLTVPEVCSLQRVLFICTWAADEPYVEVIKAACQVSRNVTIYITGNSRGRETAAGLPLPDNVVLTGYLADPEYETLLQTCDLVIDLTTREDCLVCGAYEAVAAERPLIVSDTRALRGYFDRGTLYTNNQAPDLAEKIQLALLRAAGLIREMQALKVVKQREWEFLRQGLEAQLQGLAAATSEKA